MLTGTTTKHISASARLEHGRLTSLINSMTDGVIAVDRSVRVVLYNGAALNILDRNDPIEDKPLGTLIKPINKDDQPLDLTAFIKSARVAKSSRDLKLRYADGSTINLFFSVAPVRLGYGAIGQKGYVILLRDITREKSLEEERDEFISVISHELRTPIAITEGNISNAQFIVGKTGDLTAVKQALTRAHEQVLFLSDLVNDLSTLSRAERGKLPVDVEALDIADLIAELVGSYTDQAKTKGLAFRVEADPNLKPLHSSKLYVREILQNFITNALKYTEQGSIYLNVKQSSESTIFTVTDTGIGISKGDQKRVFGKFFRSEDYRTRKTNGTGLGLYVSSKLAKLIGAKISLTSQLNHGSTFTVTIPNLASSSSKTAVRASAQQHA